MKILGTILLSILLIGSLHAYSKNGFDLSESLIPPKDILQGGPPRDGIPSIEKPKFVAASEADFIKPTDRVIGITINGESRAYPINILNWHEIVNDEIKGVPVSITYCPLCGTGLVYQSKMNGQVLKFGVSGLLYNSDVLLFDRQTETLWSQILSKAISGPMKGQKLAMIPSSQTSWASWLQKQPNTKVLSTDTGFSRDYRRSPYGDYDNNTQTYFPVSAQSRAYHPKERVLGITLNGKYKAYPFVELGKLGTNTLKDNFEGQNLTINFDVANRDGEVLDASGRPLELVNSFWFAWYAFHQDTAVFKPPK
jgi:hypothetical protein